MLQADVDNESVGVVTVQNLDKVKSRINFESDYKSSLINMMNHLIIRDLKEL